LVVWKRFNSKPSDRIQHGILKGLPIELHLPTHLLHDYFLAEIAVKMIANKQDAMVITP